ncbi:GNAT family N-acetyltransferase [Nocardioides sp. cx-169]|uniref:GNAT family N-acetyltransferase n=1 Tax=Nocardioides sp. cx-169 TaxID=2899080 RepID=UPI001E2FBB34|nr:GNAT family N-acetyltransferase [Nocardioides sp. cx-169]MCD4534847.1 GNAT family N-acetyltransferase [Nocardioides sp. cx-169]
MDLRRIDIHDDAVMRDLHRVVDAARHVDRPDAPRVTCEEYVAAVRAPDSGERAEYVAAYDGDTMVGAAIGFLFLLDNTDKAWLDVCVDPPHRGRGVGTALLDRITDVALADGRTELLADAKIPFDRLDEHPYRTFAEHRGYTQSNIEVVRHLDLPVDQERLAQWSALARERADGYRIETFVGPFPDEYAESLCVLLGQLAVDAPTGDVDFEEEVMTPERLTERYQMSLAMGREILESVALTPDGVVAAQSTLVAPVEGSRYAYQWGTFVHREHRGHRLGLAVKTANLRAVQERHPHLERVTTQNGETNDHMISINELLGFRPVEASVEFVRRV